MHMIDDKDREDGEGRKINIEKPQGLEELQVRLYDICGRVAEKYDLYRKDGQPRIAAIIESLARNVCPALAISDLRFGGRGGVDSFYGEIHDLATNILVEELCSYFTGMGLKVAVMSEVEMRFGRVDVLIESSRSSVNVRLPNKDFSLIVEVKTGNSFSLTQVFRYLCNDSDRVIVWRIKNRQIIRFDFEGTRPILEKFVRMVCLRAERLLSGSCLEGGKPQEGLEYRPTQEVLEAMFQDFMVAVDETLPKVVQTIFENLGPPTVNSE